LIDRLFKKVKNHMGWDDAKTALWFRTKNPLCGGIDPDDFIGRRPEKAERWIDSLIDDDSLPNPPAPAEEK
jgi:hypothetical protein